ncbi:MAG: cyclic nucleotide-binding domain-containing protein [Pseudomonadales bacterium]|nr:cyclic nucleotide-binding domain-containing protein [Pseudomonadales bacterium]
MNKEEHISHAVLRSLIPLSNCSDEQMDLLLLKSDIVHLYSGQVLVEAGDNALQHLYLLHGRLAVFEAGKDSVHTYIEAGQDNAFVPIADENPRPVKVVAESDCRILQINSVFLEKLICWGAVGRALLAEIAVDVRYSQDYFWIKKLLQSRLFYKIPPTYIYSVLSCFSPLSFKAGDVVIRQGEEGSCCYLIKEGIAGVFIDGQGETAVAELGPGSVFGEDALVTQKVRNATVVMQSDGVLMKLEKQDFYQLLKQPDFKGVTAGSVRSLLEGGAVLLDVRTEQEYDLKHYPDSINMPLHLCLLKSVLLNKDLRYICAAPTEERAKTAAFLLAKQGFDVRVLQGAVQTLKSDMQSSDN